MSSVSLKGIKFLFISAIGLSLSACAHTAYTRQVDGLLKSKKIEVQACFNQVYEKESVGITDGLRMEWIIVPTGQVTKLKVIAQTQLGNKAGNCISKIVEKIQFQGQSQPTLVRYPFVFTKRKPEVDFNY